MTYALIGDGRVATSLASYLPDEGLTVSRWSRNMAQARQCRSLVDVLAESQTILVAISDDAIGAWADEHKAHLADKTLIHFSGALSVPGITAMHPLYAFPTTPVPSNIMQGIPFISDAGEAAFNDVFAQLPNPHYALGAGQRPLYHALAVLAGNLPSFVWNETATTFYSDLSLPPTDVLIPYLEGLIRNLKENPFDSLTGPVRRGDQATIDTNLGALAEQPALRLLYEAFVVAHGEAKS